MKPIGLCPLSHCFVDYSGSDNALLVKGFKLKEVEIDKLSGLNVNGYVQHGGACWKRNNALLYRTYILPEFSNLIDGVPFMYGNTLQPRERKVVS